MHKQQDWIIFIFEGIQNIGTLFDSWIVTSICGERDMNMRKWDITSEVVGAVLSLGSYFSLSILKRV